MISIRQAAITLIAGLSIGFVANCSAGNSGDHSPTDTAKPIEITVYKSPSVRIDVAPLDHCNRS